jgi:hypothetical protein
MNNCEEDAVITSIQLADAAAAKPEWKEAPLGITPGPISVLGAKGGSCVAEVDSWEGMRDLFHMRSARLCSEVIVRHGDMAHIAAPPFSFLRVAGHIGGKPFEVKAKTVDTKDAEATEKFRQQVETKEKPKP